MPMLIIEKFRRLQQREQIVVIAACALAVLILSYRILWQPVNMAQYNSRLEYEEALQTRDAVKDFAEQIMAEQRSTNSADEPRIENLTSHVNQSLQARDLSLTQIQQISADQVQLRLENADFASVLAWIYDLESTPGVVVGEISIRPADTTQTGQVSITVGLSRLP